MASGSGRISVNCLFFKLQDIFSETISRYSKRCARSEGNFSMPTLLLHGVIDDTTTQTVVNGQSSNYLMSSQTEETDTCRRPGTLIIRKLETSENRYSDTHCAIICSSFGTPHKLHNIFGDFQTPLEQCHDT